MSLSAHERQALDAIEDELAGTAPELVKLLAGFTRLASGEEMPARERIRPAGRRAAGKVGRTLCGGGRGLGRQRTFLLLWLAVALSLITVALVVNRSAVRGGCTASWRVVCASQMFAGRGGLVIPPGVSAAR